MSDIDPCQVCGSRVRIRRVPVETLATTEHLEVRVCTNPGCETNSAERTLATPTP